MRVSLFDNHEWDSTGVSVKWTIKACLETVSSHNDRGTWGNYGDLLISSNPLPEASTLS